MASDIINITTKIASRTLEPMVVLKWGRECGELTPEEALQHALGIIQAAESAVQESLLVRFLDEKLHVDTQAVALVLKDWREFREQRRPRPPTQKAGGA